MRPFLAPTTQIRKHAYHDRDEHKAVEDREVKRDPTEGQRDQVYDPETERQDHYQQDDQQQDAPGTREYAGARRWRDQPHQPQPAELPGRWGLDPEALGRALEILRPTLRQRKRRVGHPP